jgi:hypothetical protein
METLVFAAIVSFDCAFAAPFFIYAVGAEVNQASVLILSTWGQIKEVQQDRYLRRMWKSFGPIKIKIGNSGNFLEKTTPLILFQMTMEQVTSLLLMR